MSTGGYFTPQSYLTLAIAAGAGLGSVFTGMAWSAKRYKLAVFFMVCIVGAETYGVMQTANRLVATRESAQAPLREQSYAKALASPNCRPNSRRSDFNSAQRQAGRDSLERDRPLDGFARATGGPRGAGVRVTMVTHTTPRSLATRSTR
jgi:hypothetical protein